MVQEPTTASATEPAPRWYAAAIPALLATLGVVVVLAALTA